LGTLTKIERDYLREQWRLFGPEAPTNDEATHALASDLEHDDDEGGEYDISLHGVHERASIATRLSAGWRACIQIRPTSQDVDPSNTQSTQAVIDIPADQIFQMLMVSFYHDETGSCRATAAFAPDLRTAVVLRCIVRITPAGHLVQNIDSSEISRVNERILQDSRSVYTNQLDISNQVWYKVLFSPDARYLSVIQSGPVFMADDEYHYLDGEFYHCSVAILEDLHPGDTNLLYQEIASTNLIDEIGGVTKPMAFHPSEPYLAIANTEAVYLWKFDEDDRHPRTLFWGRVDNLTFSSTGSFLAGEHSRSHTPVSFLVHYEQLHLLKRHDSMSESEEEASEGSSTYSMDPEDPGTEDEEEEKEEEEEDENGAESQQASVHDQMQSTHPASPPDLQSSPDTTAALTSTRTDFSLASVFAGTSTNVPRVQSAHDTHTIYTQSGLRHHSVLTTERRAGSITLQASSSTGTVQTADLLRVPKSVLDEGFHTTMIIPSTDSALLRLVLNQAPKATYRFGQAPAIQFPIVIDRRRESIPVTRTKRALGWEEQRRDGDKRLKSATQDP